MGITDLALQYNFSSPVRKRKLEERFWNRVHKLGSDDCWPWMGCISSTGYGVLELSTGGSVSVGICVHRISYMLENGVIASDIHVLHECDNKPCCNPEHLFPGNDYVNVHDAIKKGRHLDPPVKNGSSNGMSVLDESDVEDILEMRQHGFLQHQIAAEFDVSKSTISRILKNKTWMNVKRELNLSLLEG